MFFMSLAAREGGLEPFDKAVAGEGSFEDESFLYAGRKIQEWVEKNHFPEGVKQPGKGIRRQPLYQGAAMILRALGIPVPCSLRAGNFMKK